MGSVASFYLDDSTVQATRVSVNNRMATVHDARTFPREELDNYLSTYRGKTCVLCCNTSSFYQDIVHLPPAAAKYYDNLVRAEVLKNHPDLTSFTVFHRIIGESTIDGMLYNKIAAFSYYDDAFSDFISTFSRHSKTVTHLYAAVYPIFRLAASAYANNPFHDASLARLFIAAIPGRKLLLLSENGELGFIRKIPSTDMTLHSTDAQHINMTVDYCFQSLRVRPSELVSLNLAESPEESDMHLSVPFKTAPCPALANVPPDIARNYLAPLAAALHSVEAPDTGDILPADYISFAKKKWLLTSGTVLNIVLALVIAGVAVTEHRAISSLKSAISSLRRDLGNSGEELAGYKKLDAQFKELDHSREYLNKRNSSVDAEAALAALKPPAKDVLISRITCKAEENFISVGIEGSIVSSGLKETQTKFEELSGQLAKNRGFTVISAKVDIKQKTFAMQARFDGGGQLKK